MKRFVYLFFAATMASVCAPSCKSKKAETPTVNSSDTATRQAPVDIATDEDLTNGVKDATKDYPTVTADVNNGEVTLTGSVQRDRLPNLMQSIHALNPKKVNNNLKVE
jgi:osmotically-inducible protein OsmY